MLHKSFDWILRDPKYIGWQDGTDVCLLWIKGGAGKGKTMMSIGLIEELLQRPKDATVVTYFFCQNADYELNTIEAIIKGLIRQLVRQQEQLKQCLRDRWDTVHEQFSEDVTSWRGLWNIFMEMLDCCTCPRVYVIVDALDECQDDGMADLLKLIVRTGLGRPSQIKWLLTSRPLDSAEQELLAGSDQVRVSLELNSRHVSEAVKTYISYKVAELDRRCYYGSALRQDIEQALRQKAEDTFLWVSLVCKGLEDVHRDKALSIIQDLPPGLHPYYHRMFSQLSSGQSTVVKGCIRLLKVMMLAYRPLNLEELGSVTGLSDGEVSIEVLVDRCASFVKMRGTNTEFVHESAREYLAGKDGQPILDSYDQYGHAEVVLNCLTYLSERLKINLVDLPRPDFTRERLKELKDEKKDLYLASLDYAATFWVQHLHDARRNALVGDALVGDVLTEQGEIGTFLRTKLLEWLECLSLLDRLPIAIHALGILTDAADVS